MSVPQRAYRFATESQWQSCLQVQVDPSALQTDRGISPFTPLSMTPILHPSAGAFAPIVKRTGDILWRDEHHRVHRLAAGDDEAETIGASGDLGRARRIVETPGSLWVLTRKTRTIARYEAETLARVLVVDLPGIRATDIAPAEHGGLWVLTTHGGAHQALRLDSSGHVKETVTFNGPALARAFVFLRRSKRFVLLADDGTGHRRLYWFAPAGGDPLFSQATAPLHLGFRARVIATDSRDRLLLGGRDSDECCGQALVAVLDADGNLLMTVPVDDVDAPVKGVAASPDGGVVVAVRRGLLRFAVVSAVPDSAGQISCSLITPVLYSPDREDGRRWLRIEASAHLPEGSTLHVDIASTDDAALAARLKAMATDTGRSASARASRLAEQPEFWRPLADFQGSAASAGESQPPYAARLYQVRDRYVWVRISLSAAPGAQLPRLTELRVLYPGRTLMEHLPSIYQREESQPDGFLRNFIGVLEATTQGMDGRIASMGSLVHPETAPVQWLDFVARWLGIPWDDALDPVQKRALIQRAAVLSKQRGTRAGLEALLDSLIPGTPRRFRMTDESADFGFATVGGASCAGTALPALLGGRTRWAAELDSRAVLGRMRLPCEGQLDDGVYQLAGTVRIEIAATAAERRAWEPWMRALIGDMVPLTVRVSLQWVSERALRSGRVDGTMTLEGVPTAHLGTDAITSVARLPERGGRLSTFGPAITTRAR